MKLKYIFSILLVLIIVSWFYIVLRNKNIWDNIISEEINTLNALPITYSLESAIDDGYYYEKEAIDKIPNSIIKFLSYVDDNARIKLKIAFEKEKRLILTNIFYESKKFTVINYYINHASNKRSWEKDEYKYLIVSLNQENKIYSYYLTNNTNLYKSIKENPDYNIYDQDVFYLFSRSYAAKEPEL